MNYEGLAHGWTEDAIRHKYAGYENEDWFPKVYVALLDEIVTRQEAQWKSEHDSGFQSYVTREKELQGIRGVEKTVNRMSCHDKSLTGFLALYGFEGSARKIGRDVFAIQANAESQKMIDRLPDGFVYIGGSARAILERSLGVDKYAEPRDVDIAVMGGDQSKELIDQMSEQYMPEDYAFGHGIKKESPAYFETRDFTINEVFATHEAVYCTKQCLLDTLRGIVRFTSHEKRDGFSAHPKLMAKALRLAVLRNKKLAEEDESEYSYPAIDMFHLALHFGRAMGQGVGDEYTQALRERGQIPEVIQSVDDLKRYIEEESCYSFRSTSNEEVDKEETWLESKGFWEDIEDEYQDLPLREGMGR